MKKAWVAVVVAVLVSVFAFFAYGLYIALEFERQFNSFPNHTGRVLSTSDRNIRLVNIQGGDTVNGLNGRTFFLNFTEGWYWPSKDELPRIVQLKRAIGDSICFLVIARERKYDSLLQMMAKQNDLPFYYLLDSLPTVFDIKTFPRTYVIRENKIKWHRNGIADWDSPFLIRLVDSLSKGR